MVKHPKPSPNEAYTPAERGAEMEDMILRRAEEIRKERARKSKIEAKKQKHLLIEELKHARMIRRCRNCKAMKFYLKSGRKPPK